MAPTETTQNEPEDTDVQYDLAGNPLPARPKPAVPPGVHFAAPPQTPSQSGFTPPPTGSTPPTGFTPPPGSFLPPPGAGPGYAPPVPAKAPVGPGLYFGLGAGLIVLLGLIFGLSALKPKLVKAPVSYTPYNAIDNSFSCDQPGGTEWTMHETGATSGNLATVTFQSGHVRVRVVSDATGSIMGDIATAGNANLPPEQQVPAVQKLHMHDVAVLANDLPGYKEGDAQPFQSQFGDSRVSEWTADGSLHGYRVTMLTHEREITVICICPERNWAVLKPAFLQIINSIKAGTGPN